MFNKKTIFVSLLLSVFLFFSFPVEAMVTSQVNFTALGIEKHNLEAGEEIRGSFTLKNYEKEVVPDITYSYGLLAQDEYGLYTIVLDEKFSGDNFSLGPDQIITKSFKYKLPQNLISGRHVFRIQLFNSKGLFMSRKDVNVDIRSDDRFLTLQNHFLWDEDRTFLPKGEAVYDVGRIPRISFDILNESSFRISATPKLSFYYYNIAEKSFQVIEEQVLTIEPGDSQSQTFDLIGFQEPGVYFCRLTMYENNRVISNSLDFRWKVPGKEVEIMQFRIDKASYKEGEEALVIVYLSNVADFPTQEKGELHIRLFDSDGSLAGEKTEEVSLKRGKIESKILVAKNISNPRVEITVLGKDRTILDSYQGQLRDDEAVDKVVDKEPLREEGNVLLLIAILIVIVAFIYYVLKKRPSVVKTVFVMLICSAIFFAANSALASIYMASGTYYPIGDPEEGEEMEPSAHITWESPLPDEHDYYHEAGSYVQFKGQIYLDGPENIKDDEIRFFITGTENVHYKKQVTPPGVYWIIDEDETHNLIDLGSYTHPSPNPVDLIHYNVVFQIPEDCPHLGKDGARLYVAFKGKHAASNTWRWIIAYQVTTIQAAGEGGLYIDLDAGQTEALPGDEIDWTVSFGNKAPCIRSATDIIPIIDVSGSMNAKMPDGQTRIKRAKDAAIAFVNKFDPNIDQLGLVSYASTSSLRSVLTLNHSSVITAINNLSVGGCTCISCGVYTANKEMSSIRGRAHALPYHILLTDGEVNMKMDGSTAAVGCAGVWQPAYDETIYYANEANDLGITIYTIGFAMPTAGKELMEEIAELTGGQFYNAPSGDELNDAFESIAGIITGDSIGTKVRIEIPDNLEFTSYDSRCKIEGKDLVCSNLGTLGCGDQTKLPDIKFTTRVVSGESGQEIEVTATISNISNKEKQDSGIVILMGRPIAQIKSPEANKWLTGHDTEGTFVEYFEAEFEYSQDIPDTPGLASCQYRVESRVEEGAWAVTRDWSQVDEHDLCSGGGPVELIQQITVGTGKDCRNQGESVCRISVRAIDTQGTESSEAGEWRRTYHIDWIPPAIQIN